MVVLACQGTRGVFWMPHVQAALCTALISFESHDHSVPTIFRKHPGSDNDTLAPLPMALSCPDLDLAAARQIYPLFWQLPGLNMHA